MRRGRTSTAAPQANAVMHRHPDCSEGRRRLAARSPHGHEQHARTTDATGREPRVPRSYGRYLVALYNAERPHSSLGWQTPSAFAQPGSVGARNGTGRSRDPRAARPVRLRRTPKTPSITQGHQLRLDENWGARHFFLHHGRHLRIEVRRHVCLGCSHHFMLLCFSAPTQG